MVDDFAVQFQVFMKTFDDFPFGSDFLAPMRRHITVLILSDGIKLLYLDEEHNSQRIDIGTLF